MNNELRETYWSHRNFYHFFQVRLQPSGNINNHLRKNNEGMQCLIQNHKYCISLQGHIGKYCICIIPLLYDAGCVFRVPSLCWYEQLETSSLSIDWLICIYIYIYSLAYWNVSQHHFSGMTVCAGVFTVAAGIFKIHHKYSVCIEKCWTSNTNMEQQ